MIETQQSISEWAEQTFGPVSSSMRVAIRTNEEVAELLGWLAIDDDHQNAGEEMADIAIMLNRLATHMGFNLSELVDSKMAINRRRKWVKDGTGCGYKEP